MQDLSEQDERMVVLHRRVRSDLFAAVVFSLVVVAIMVWGVWHIPAVERYSRRLILGALLFVVFVIPSWRRWFRSRTRLRDPATVGEDAQGLG